MVGKTRSLMLSPSIAPTYRVERWHWACPGMSTLEYSIVHFYCLYARPVLRGKPDDPQLPFPTLTAVVGGNDVRPDDADAPDDLFIDPSCRPLPRGYADRLPPDGRRHPPLYLHRCPPPCPPVGTGPRLPRGTTGRAHRHARVEQPPPLGDLLRRVRHGRRVPHHQPASVPRADRLHHQPCRGQLRVLRCQLHRTDRGSGASLPAGQGLGGDDRPRPSAAERTRPVELRRTCERALGRSRVADIRREHGSRSL